MRANSAVVILGVALLTGACAPQDGSLAAGGGKVGTGVYDALAGGTSARIIVILRDPEGPVGDLSARRDVITAVQGGVLASVRPGEIKLTHRWDFVSGFAGEASAAAIAALEAHPDVLRIDIDRPLHAFTAESVPMIRGEEARGAGLTGRGITVAVLDTGVDINHGDFAGRIVDQQCFCTGCCPNGTGRQSGAGAGQDDQGHGTNVAGIIGSAGRVSPVGVAPESGILAMKVLSRTGSGNTSDTVSALDFLNTRPDVRVANLSLGGGKFGAVCDNSDAANQALARAFNTISARGIVSFAAAGNEAHRDGIASPACLNGTISVGAVYDGNVGGISAGICSDPSTRSDLVTCFSNSSSLVQLLAPGAMITSSGVGGGTSTDAGTSQATPHAAGAAAVLLQANPGLTPGAILAALAQTGVPVTDPKNGVTAPRIDIVSALSRVR